MERKYFIDKVYEIPRLKEDKSNLSDFFSADLFETRDESLKNYGGYPRNELAIINEAQSAASVKALADRLASVPDDTKVGVSETDLRLSLKSRYDQSPSEEIAYYERILEERDKRVAFKRDQMQRRKQAALDKQELAELRESLTPEEREMIRQRKRENLINKLV